VSQLRQFFLALCSTISPKHDDSSPYGELAILLAPVLSDYFLVGPDRPTAPEKVELLFGTDGVDIFDTLDRSRRWLLAIDSAAAGQEGLESGCPMTLLVKLVRTRFLDNAAKRKQNAPDCFETFSTKSHCNYRCDRSERFPRRFLGCFAGRICQVAQQRCWVHKTANTLDKMLKKKSCGGSSGDEQS